MLKMLSLMKCYIKHQCVLNQQPNMISYRLKIRENCLDSTQIIKSFIYIKNWSSCLFAAVEVGKFLSTFLPLSSSGFWELSSQNCLRALRCGSLQAASDPSNLWLNQLFTGENIHSSPRTLNWLWVMAQPWNSGRRDPRRLCNSWSSCSGLHRDTGSLCPGAGCWEQVSSQHCSKVFH